MHDERWAQLSHPIVHEVLMNPDTPRSWMERVPHWVVAGCAALALAAVILILRAESPPDGRVITPQVDTPRDEAVGTSASGDPGSGSTLGLNVAEGLAQTGLDQDVNGLVGRRITLQIAAPDPADVAFWISDPSVNARLLAVMHRDTRSPAQRMAASPSRHEIARFAAGTPLIVSGVIERVPPAEERYSWRLTGADADALADRPVYFRVDSAAPVGS
jgi:hypothetical protein